MLCLQQNLMPHQVLLKAYFMGTVFDTTMLLKQLRETLNLGYNLVIHYVFKVCYGKMIEVLFCG